MKYILQKYKMIAVGGSKKVNRLIPLAIHNFSVKKNVSVRVQLRIILLNPGSVNVCVCVRVYFHIFFPLDYPTKHHHFHYSHNSDNNDIGVVVVYFDCF